MAGAREIKAGSAFVEIGGEYAAFEKSLNDAGRKFESFGKRLESIGSRIASKMSRIGATIGAAFGAAGTAISVYLTPLKLLGQTVGWVADRIVGLAQVLATQFKRGMLVATGALALGVKSFESLEHAMSEVQVTAELSDDSMRWLTDAVRDLASEVGIVPKELASALAIVMDSALEGAGDMQRALKFLEAAAVGAKTNFVDLETQVRTMRSVMEAFDLTVEDSERVMDMLLETSRAGNLNFQTMQRSFGELASLSRQVGIGMEEMLAAFATLSKARGSQKALQALQYALEVLASPTEELKRMFDLFGITLDEETIKTKGLHGVLRDLVSGVTWYVAEQRKAGNVTMSVRDVFTQMFPTLREFGTVLELATTRSGEFDANIKRLEGSAGKGRAAFRLMADDVRQNFMQAWASLVSMISQFGDILAPVVNDALQILRDWFDVAGKWLSAHEQELQTYAVRAWNWVKEAINDVWEWFKTEFAPGMNDENFSLWETIKDAASGIWTTVGDAWEAAKPYLEGFLDWVKLLFAPGGFEAALDELLATIDAYWPRILSLIDFTRPDESGRSVIDKAVEFGTMIVEKLQSSGFVDNIVGLIAKIFEVNNAIWKVAIEWAWELGKVIAKALWKAFGDEIKGAGWDIGKGAYGFFSPAGAALLEGAEKLASGGIVRRPTIALVGEEGPEAVIPLKDPTGVQTGMPTSQLTQNITVHVRNPLDPAVAEGIDENMRRMRNRGRIA